MKWDVFIAHASEDKEEVVEPIASLLKDLGVNVWYDDFILELGDSLSRKIDHGLANSRYGIIVISHDFFNKSWPQRELGGLVSRATSTDDTVILPIWHNIDRAEITGYSPTLVDLRALQTSKSTINEITLLLLEKIRPDIYDELLRLSKVQQLIKSSDINRVNLESLKQRPIKHETLHPVWIARIKLMYWALPEVWPTDLDSMIDSFKRDVDPLKEIIVMEVITGTLLRLKTEGNYDIDKQKELLWVLTQFYNRNKPVDLYERVDSFNNSEIDHFYETYMNAGSENP